MTVVEWSVSGAKVLRFNGREFHKRGEELRNDRSGGNRWKDTDDLRNGLLGGLIFMSL